MTTGRFQTDLERRTKISTIPQSLDAHIAVSRTAILTAFGATLVDTDVVVDGAFHALVEVLLHFVERARCRFSFASVCHLRLVVAWGKSANVSRASIQGSALPIARRVKPQ